MSSSLRDSDQTDMSDVKTQVSMEMRDLGSQNSDCLQPRVTQVGPQGAPVLTCAAPKQSESCRERSCQGDVDSSAKKSMGVNGPVVRDRPSSPSRLQTPALSEPALLNHIDAKTESSSPLSSCMQRDTPSSTSLASDSPAHHHSSAVGNSSSSVLNSSLSSQTKGIWAYITLYSCALRFNSHHHPCLPTDKWVIALLIYTAQELSSHLC